jgi:cell division protein FtsZ
VLRQAVQGISDIITTPGLINRDFSDIRTIMLGMGYAMMGTASASGENAAVIAAQKAISCPLMEAGGVRGARGVLINITGSSRLGLHEVNEACTLIRQAAQNEDVQINFGVVMNEAMGDEVKITVIATGFERENLPAIARRDARAPVQVSMSTSMPDPAPQMTMSSPAPQMELDEAEPEYVEAEHEPALVYDEAPVAMAAAANGSPQSEPLFDDLDVPAILRRDRRLIQ